jgi:hypothetical protein
MLATQFNFTFHRKPKLPPQLGGLIAVRQPWTQCIEPFLNIKAKRTVLKPGHYMG